MARVARAKPYAHVLGFALDHPWALTPAMCAMVASILARHLGAEDPEVVGLVPRANLPQAKRGTAAVIPVYGVIAPRMNLLSEFSGGTTFEALSAQLRAAVEDDTIKTIVLDVDSPGGNVAGATEFAREVLKARERKPIIAQAQFQMASAAYWLAACATEVVAAPSAMVGAIGVYTIYDDVSEALAAIGVKRELIVAGKFKAEGADGGPLTDAARTHLHAIVDAAYGNFVADVAKGRGVSTAAVRSGYGEGRLVGADEALALGLIDRIATLGDTLARLTGGTARSSLSAPAATAQELPPAATAQEPPPPSTADHDQLWCALQQLSL
jgi:signal peptide peptidase SppA